jgi:23S rRNA (cytidine1920-2'-O)/16S rRNA (cytidine1409-2'-O)-methyltransferase
LICLVKPQFEAGREHVTRGGVVKDPSVHQRVLEELASFVQTQLELSVVNATHSPIKGPAGNIEFLMHIRNEPARSAPIDWARLVEHAHKEL